ncbi:MAG: DUF4365 domain-containing protein, partial [Candidatus Latescibacter sp.]|nr:DUF4365 domain-containing protein [Candidatus Latescibacter sp.]
MGKLRPRQHEIDDQACKQFGNALPNSWLLRYQGKDYGIDSEVEIFERGQSTGIIFKVQIKGTENPKFIANETIISLSLTIDDLTYFCEELKVPTIIILCDVINNRTWWHAIQLDSDLRTKIQKAREKGRLSITLHIDTLNKIPLTLWNLFEKV